jgi:cbb3-type cytochrome oxidase subunit 3
MDDQLDNDLRNRIREVFENYDDEHADEGWLLLREKYPEKAKRRPIAWLWWGSVAAALILLFLGILWYNYTPKKENQFTGNKQHPAHLTQKPAESKKDNNKGIDESNRKADSVLNSLQKEAIANNKVSSDHTHKNTADKTNHSKYNPVALNKATKENIIHIPPADNGLIANNPVKDSAAVNAVKSQSKPSIEANKMDNAVAKIDSGNKTDVKPMAVVTQPGVNMQDQMKKPNKTLFANDEVPKNKKPEKSEFTDRAVRFGVYATSYVNYAKGSNNQMNLGAGISSDIRLSRKFNLSTGVSIAQNTLSFGSQLPSNTAKLNAATSSIASADNQLAFAAATPALKNYNANLVGLDVPINLKYQFNPEKNAAFVSLGVSSGTFINETYTSTYNLVTPFASNLSQTTDQSLHQSFSSFYFAKTLNFSFGTGYRIGGNDLIIEPFLKYPIEGLGSQQIKFGSGGLNLKFSLQTKRK